MAIFQYLCQILKNAIVHNGNTGHSNMSQYKRKVKQNSVYRALKLMCNFQNSFINCFRRIVPIKTI